MDKKLIDKLKKREEEGTLRSLSHFDGFIDFFSNDYLGVSKIDFHRNSNSFGGTGSRLISGTTKETLKIEQGIADFFSTDGALIFNSGYDANIGLLSAVPQRGDTVIYDELIHASIRDGLRIGFGDSYSFTHNDVNDLAEKLNKAKGTVYVVVEALYSMDGDLAELRPIAEVCDEFNAYLIVDEAHSCGVFGENGKGLVDALHLQDKVFARVVTFGKAYGSHGACVIGSNDLIKFLVNFARSFIYTTALPPHAYERISEVIHLPTLNERREALQTNIKYFRSNYLHSGLISEVNSPIQILQLGDISTTKTISQTLQEALIAVKPIFSPTVQEGKERLRICLHSDNTKNQIDRLIQVLSQF